MPRRAGRTPSQLAEVSHLRQNHVITYISPAAPRGCVHIFASHAHTPGRGMCAAEWFVDKHGRHPHPRGVSGLRNSEQTAPCRGYRRQDETDGREDTGSHPDGHNAAGRRPHQVLDRLTVTGPGQLNHGHHRTGIVTGQHHAHGFHCNISAHTDGNTDPCPGQGGGVMDTITDHRHTQATSLQFKDPGVLILRQDLGETSSIPSSWPTALATWRASPVIMATCAPAVLQSADRCTGFGTYLALGRHGPDGLTITHDVENSGTAPRPPVGGADDVRRGAGGYS